MSLPKKRRTIGRSFRIDEEWFKVLQKEAEREGITVNSLMNKILRQYSLVHRHTMRYDNLLMPKQGIKVILDSVPEEQINKIAKLLGTTIILDTFRAWGIPKTHDSLVAFIKNLLSDYAHWFKYDHHVFKDKEVFHFRHNLGPKWSIFIAEVIPTAFKFLLNKTTNYEIVNGSVTITIEKKNPL